MSSIALLTVLCAGCTNIQLDEIDSRADPVVGDALPGLTAMQQQAFLDGKDAFVEVEDVEEGLGPVFNEKSCGTCHFRGAIGGAGTQFEVRAGRLENGVFDSLVAQGGQLFDLFSVMSLPASQRQDIPNCTLPKNGEPVPANANVIARRRTTALFGLGLVDATPDQTFITLAASQPPAIQGHVNTVFNIVQGANAVGKFGWKAQVPTLFQFSADAYLNEMGITSQQFPNEQAPSGNPATIAACDVTLENGSTSEDDGEDVQAFTDFMRMLAPIAPATSNAQTEAGSALFTQIGCDGCHVRTLTSGSSEIAALSNQTYHPFSDFLLHNMGSLGDNIGDNGTAGVTEMRTAPLWGLRLLGGQNLLHDGRASGTEDAILRHDGQGLAARNAFSALSGADRAKVLAFLNTL